MQNVGRAGMGIRSTCQNDGEGIHVSRWARDSIEKINSTWIRAVKNISDGICKLFENINQTLEPNHA